MTGEDYDLMLHCTIGHLRRVDGALPPFADGEKALNLLAPKGEPRCILCIFCIFLHILHIIALICFACRHCLRTTQPVYGFWYYFMIHRGIGATLQKLMPKLVPRNDKDVDALLDCKLRVYVSYYAYFAYFAYFVFCIF